MSDGTSLLASDDGEGAGNDAERDRLPIQIPTRCKSTPVDTYKSADAFGRELLLFRTK